MKRVTLYTKTGCTTCNKAKQLLMQRGIHYTERDIFKHPLNEQELRSLADKRSLQALFSHRSPSVKALGLQDRELSDEELVSYMLQEPRLIRRPLVTAGEAIAVGYLPEQIDEILA